MRNFEQRMAEIRHRSDKILARRKNMYRAILAVCVPLVLCVGLWALLPKPDAGLADAGALMGSSGTDSLVCSYSEVRIQGGGPAAVDQTVTDKVAVAQIFNAIHACYYERAESAVEDIPEDQNDNSAPKEQFASGSTEDPEYTITLSTSWGAQRIFALCGNQLTDKATGQIWILTAAQSAQLYDVLGLS